MLDTEGGGGEGCSMCMVGALFLSIAVMQCLLKLQTCSLLDEIVT